MFDLDLSPLRLSLQVGTLATAICLVVGVALAWLLARRQFWGRGLLSALVTLPLVLSREWITVSWSIQALVMLWIAGRLNSQFLRNLARDLFITEKLHGKLSLTLSQGTQYR